MCPTDRGQPGMLSPAWSHRVLDAASRRRHPSSENCEACRPFCLTASHGPWLCAPPCLRSDAPKTSRTPTTGRQASHGGRAHGTHGGGLWAGVWSLVGGQRDVKSEAKAEAMAHTAWRSAGLHGVAPPTLWRSCSRACRRRGPGSRAACADASSDKPPQLEARRSSTCARAQCDCASHAWGGSPARSSHLSSKAAARRERTAALGRSTSAPFTGVAGADGGAVADTLASEAGSTDTNEAPSPLDNFHRDARSPRPEKLCVADSAASGEHCRDELPGGPTHLRQHIGRTLSVGCIFKFSGPIPETLDFLLV